MHFISQIYLCIVILVRFWFGVDLVFGLMWFLVFLVGVPSPLSRAAAPATAPKQEPTPLVTTAPKKVPPKRPPAVTAPKKQPLVTAPGTSPNKEPPKRPPAVKRKSAPVVATKKVRPSLRYRHGVLIWKLVGLRFICARGTLTT